MAVMLERLDKHYFSRNRKELYITVCVNMHDAVYAQTPLNTYGILRRSPVISSIF